ncbi:MAG: type III pantothenate kinase [Eubacteriales bacterium]|nr:type III pantothenate kinase [Eubacteriales bacterium]MDD3350491.1 type III pantothenate kinase [Eubacteriales bacterium]
MILVIDVGNTNIVIGGMEKDQIVFQARYSTDRAKTEDEYALMFMDMFRLESILPDEIEGGIISSVVPELRKVLMLAIKKITGKCLMILGPDIETDLVVDMDIPGQLGSDQIADAIAALAKYPTPILIFDMGTATTLSVISKDGVYRGGMIIPGLKLSVEALYTKTSLLPRISLEKPAHLIGKNTTDCMKAGAIYGNAAMMDGLIERLEEELGEKATVLATGGLIKEIVPYCKREIIMDKDLILSGLQMLYEKNKNAPKHNR